MSEPNSSSDAAEAKFKDRRTFPRRRPRGDGAIVPADKPMAPSFGITLVNISQGGVGFVSARPLTVGQRIIVELQAPGSSRPLSVQAEVRWIVADVRPGRFRVGCAWVERLQYHNLVHFV